MAASTGKAVEAAQEFLKEAVEDANAAKLQYENLAKRRRYLAYTLKGIALFGGLFVAVVQIAPAVFGAIISGAVLLDQLFSNHRRMISEQVAANAVQRTLRKVQGDYNHRVIDVIDAAERGQHDAAERVAGQKLLLQLARECTKLLRDELNQIHTAVEQADIEFLSALNVDRPGETSASKPV
jgi:hypothetical protein